jgi:hypothetical protein
MIDRAMDEAAVCTHGGFLRLFPSAGSWAIYGSFLEDRGRLNWTLHHALYPFGPQFVLYYNK